MGLAPGAGRLDGGRMPGGADAVNERSLVRVRDRVRSVRVRVRVVGLGLGLGLGFGLGLALSALWRKVGVVSVVSAEASPSLSASEPSLHGSCRLG